MHTKSVTASAASGSKGIGTARMTNPRLVPGSKRWLRGSLVERDQSGHKPRTRRSRKLRNPTKRLAPPAGVDSEWTESSSAGRSQRRTTEAVGRSQPATNGLGIRYSKLARIVRVLFSTSIRVPHLAELAERARACTHVAPDVAPDVAEVVRLAGVIAACGEPDAMVG